MYGLAFSIKNTTLTPIQKHLIKIRASQINGCAFCINMHTKEALNIGETQQRIFLLNAWKETDWFNEEEKVILTLTEEITVINQHGVSEAAYKKAQLFFNTQAIAEIIMAAVIINAWNRIMISTLAPIGG